MKYCLLDQPLQEVVLPCKQPSFFYKPGIPYFDLIGLSSPTFSLGFSWVGWFVCFP